MANHRALKKKYRKGGVLNPLSTAHILGFSHYINGKPKSNRYPKGIRRELYIEAYTQEYTKTNMEHLSQSIKIGK